MRKNDKATRRVGWIGSPGDNGGGCRWSREAERRGKAAANTGPSTSNEGRVNSGAEETNEPAGGSGSYVNLFYCNEPLPPAGSFVSSAPLFTRPSLLVDGPVLAAAFPLLSASRFNDAIATTKQQQYRPTTTTTVVTRTTDPTNTSLMIILGPTVHLPDLQVPLSCPLVPPRQALPRSLPTASTPPSPRAGRHDFFRDDPRWIRKPDPPSTDRPPRSAEDAGSAPDGSFAPRMQIYPDSALPPAHTNCRHT
ncbi:hypothetical protein T4D_12136 [Trichinella pseudospiralis]|uniref:Uncharacterized protein n=1 Tax=Trichinella pseudospiralis TaxID=6337 RepID=A0A0V1FM88_TRIPS|nr:hypothetical protein T4D_12136 [Trichinella pseudospiralis]